jgi:hypothetical protein
MHHVGNPKVFEIPAQLPFFLFRSQFMITVVVSREYFENSHCTRTNYVREPYKSISVSMCNILEASCTNISICKFLDTSTFFLIISIRDLFFSNPNKIVKDPNHSITQVERKRPAGLFNRRVDRQEKRRSQEIFTTENQNKRRQT